MGQSKTVNVNLTLDPEQLESLDLEICYKNQIIRKHIPLEHLRTLANKQITWVAKLPTESNLQNVKSLECKPKSNK